VAAKARLAIFGLLDKKLLTMTLSPRSSSLKSFTFGPAMKDWRFDSGNTDFSELLLLFK
jgi:hypothetical protein